MTEPNPKEILRQYFGYENFRPGQLEIVQAVLNGRDTLAILPTGGGKSICFQVPGLALGGTTLVITPLISLMQDQVQRLISLGIRATYINSSLSRREMRERLVLLGKGYWQFVYVAPERLPSPELMASYAKLDCKLVVVDEAHCISEWGHDFRPAYRHIPERLSLLPKRPVMLALTATATPTTQQDIQTCLHLNQPFHYFHTFKRSNLRLQIKNCQSSLHKELQLVRILKHHAEQSGIIYVATRTAAESVSQWLNNFHIFHQEILAYHGGLEHTQRQVIQQRFISNQNQVIVATNAFGMGIDKPDIRFVVHYHLPGTLENYVQEIGRAGRDGETADCYLLSLVADQPLIADLNQPSTQSSRFYQDSVKRKWERMLHVIDSPICRAKNVLDYFGENSENCGVCDVCQPPCRLEAPYEQYLFGQLLKTRTQLAKETRQPQAFVTPVSILKWLALLQPQTASNCAHLPGVGAGWLKDWWPYFAGQFVHKPAPASRARASA